MRYLIDTVYVEQLGFWPCGHFWGDLYTMKCEGQIHPKNHIWYTVDEVVDRPTQLICISDIYLLFNRQIQKA